MHCQTAHRWLSASLEGLPLDMANCDAGMPAHCPAVFPSFLLVLPPPAAHSRQAALPATLLSGMGGYLRISNTSQILVHTPPGCTCKGAGTKSANSTALCVACRRYLT